MISPEFVINTDDIIHPNEKAVKMHESQPSILKIKEVFALTDCFCFNFITSKNTIITEIKNLVLVNNFNNCIAFGQFPYKLKFTVGVLKQINPIIDRLVYFL